MEDEFPFFALVKAKVLEVDNGRVHIHTTTDIRQNGTVNAKLVRSDVTFENWLICRAGQMTFRRQVAMNVSVVLKPRCQVDLVAEHVEVQRLAFHSTAAVEGCAVCRGSQIANR